jgi:hypothetical protein
MSYLRHPALFIWIAIVVLLAGILAVGACEGRTHPQRLSSASQEGLIASYKYAVPTLVANLGQMDADLGSGASLHSWAVKEAKLARTAARDQSPNVGSGPLVRDYRAVEKDAVAMENLSATATSKERWAVANVLSQAVSNLIVVGSTDPGDQPNS